MQTLDTSKQALRKFGITMGIAFLIISALAFFKHPGVIKIMLPISLLFFLCAFTGPLVLKPIYVLWMKLAHVLGWLNTRLLLSIMFYLVFTPIGLVLRLLRIDLLDRKIEKNTISYWKQRNKLSTDKSHFEHQY